VVVVLVVLFSYYIKFLSALILLVGHQEEHPASKNLSDEVLMSV